MTEPRTRTRTRALDTEDMGEVQPTPEIIKTVQEVFAANKAKNKATREEKTAKKSLLKLVACVKGLTRFMVKCGTKDVEVKYGPTKSERVNAAKLYKLTGDIDKVLGIASFSQKDVEETFGSNVLAQCLDTTPADHAVSVKEYKD